MKRMTNVRVLVLGYYSRVTVCLRVTHFTFVGLFLNGFYYMTSTFLSSLTFPWFWNHSNTSICHLWIWKRKVHRVFFTRSENKNNFLALTLKRKEYSSSQANKRLVWPDKSIRKSLQITANNKLYYRYGFPCLENCLKCLILTFILIIIFEWNVTTNIVPALKLFTGSMYKFGHWTKCKNYVK